MQIPDLDLSAQKSSSSSVPASQRASFLAELGFSHDPFSTPVAETESGSKNRYHTLYDYFTPPSLKPPFSTPDPIKALRQPEHAFILGAPGAGKTTLRLILELDCRQSPENTLVVTYYLGDNVEEPLSGNQHAARLARELAIDFFIQVVEQFNPLEPAPDAKQFDALVRQFQIGGSTSRRLARKLSNSSLPDDPMGLGVYIPLIARRMPSRRITASKELLALLDLCLNASSSAVASPSDWQAVEQSLEDARAWGYAQSFILVDGVDARLRGVKEMELLIRPLIEQLGEWSDREIYAKGFLPGELEKTLPATLKAILRKPYYQGTIEWSRSSLLDLVSQRFGAAGARYTSFNQLAAPDLNNELDGLILRSARGSPRRLLQIISHLIDVHIGSGGEQRARTPFFTRADWQAAERTFQYGAPHNL